MTAELYSTGFSQGSFESLLARAARRADVAHLYAAVAYISVPGVQRLQRICSSAGIETVHILTDTRDHVTHPRALMLAKGWGWKLRICNSPGTFHSKILIFSKSNRMASDAGPKCLLVGSNNLSERGFEKSHETGVFLQDVPNLNAGQFFQKIWAFGHTPSQLEISNYQSDFKTINRQRSRETLSALGVLAKEKPKPNETAVQRDTAEAVWCGLQSFTGDYDLQVEFPKTVGDILSVIRPASNDDRVDLLCDDGLVRSMIFKFYGNSMWRLNIPNDVPKVPDVRQDRNGIAIIEKTNGETTLRLRIVRNAHEIDDVKAVSSSVGQLGETSTRFFGWF